MPLTHPELVDRLKALGMAVQVPPDQDLECGMFVPTHRYRNAEGKTSLLVVCTLEDEGRFLEMAARNTYAAADCRYKGALFAALLEMAFRTRLVQPEYDPRDGEIRFTVEIPVIDGTVTSEQLRAMASILVRVVDEFDPVIRHAMETGRVDMGLLPRPTSGAEPGLEPGLLSLAEEVGGLEALRRIVAEHRSRANP
jgi:hypothetical protein